MNPVDAFCKHFEQFHRSSPSDLRKFYTEDVEFIDPVNHLHGLNNLATYLSALRDKVEECTFCIHSISESVDSDIKVCFVSWTMMMKLSSLPTKPIEVEGVSHLKVKADGIFFHRDYFDVGQLVYENIPLLKWVIKAIKSRLREA
ncbi:nuclear transport factor 2 family protein [Alteromonas ponticola]|uniref:SnoaL-like domain-containing protein n=1 Tax=Alteromonas ponticola TaxID=2720613 RepID=A0ABX1R0A7_9ALTE|nr:nuclear transport factor 2 family protein [Alteromonas ponticola]NMH58902.1 SnoaL-like domain-containing protein [Alteromonas ponticola]